MGFIPPRPLVYIAGPYKGEQGPVANIRRAIQVGEVIETYHCAIIIPHLNMVWDLVSPQDEAVWYQRDLDVLRHCQALVRIEGESVGADAEVEFARFHGIRTFTYTDDGMTAFKTWREAQL